MIDTVNIFDASTAAGAAPSHTLGLCVCRADAERTKGSEDIDVRQTLKLEEVELPPLEADEALVGVMASAINYNTVWSATFRPRPTFEFLDRLAKEALGGERHRLDHHVLGSDAAGVIVQTGSNVRHWDLGDHVVVHPLWTDEQDPRSQSDGMLPAVQKAWGYETNFGGLAHYAVVKATQLLPKPRNLTWEEAACGTSAVATAYRMLIGPNGSRVRLGDATLIWGATGGLGAFATQLAKAAGCTVVGVVGSDRKVDIARRLGCDAVIDRTVVPGGDGLRSMTAKRWLGSKIRSEIGRDVDHVFEYVGEETFDASVYLVRRGGTVVTCGSSTGYLHTYDNRHLWMKLKRIIGSHGANYDEAANAVRLLSEGVIAPTVSETFPLAEAAEAARQVQTNAHMGKIGILCLAPEPGLGITDLSARSKLDEERLSLFTMAAQ
jgi:crotonyl-CoA reductase